jgi:hypothetical protein
MARALGVLVTAGLLAVCLTAPAAGHRADPDTLSRIDAVTPRVPGLSLRIVQRGDQLELSNRSGRVVVVQGYTREPYLRFLPDGTVQENRRSPAAYLNRDRYGTQRIPSRASPRATPRWVTVARNGRFAWHDHRIHYMALGTPRQVKDPGRPQKVFDWTVPLRAGSTPVVVTGALLWTPQGAGDDGGGSWLVVVGVLGLLACALAVVMLVRRRRTMQAA